jgi:hypothetical protein
LPQSHAQLRAYTEQAFGNLFVTGAAE